MATNGRAEFGEPVPGFASATLPDQEFERSKLQLHSVCGRGQPQLVVAGLAEEDTWPADVSRVESVEAFRDAFATLGYVVCSEDVQEASYEKVALFVLAGVPKHAARQLPNGRWTSKLGAMEDIEHSLHDLTGMLYGSVVLVMKRPRDRG